MERYKTRSKRGAARGVVANKAQVHDVSNVVRSTCSVECAVDTAHFFRESVDV